MKLLTVTVPSYNAEKTLARTLDSLCAAARAAERLQVLVINDGSKDGTEALARRYQTEWPDTVRVISKENGGHGSGINVGLQNAEGRYFAVVDADDWVDTAALNAILDAIEGGLSADLLLSEVAVEDDARQATRVTSALASLSPFETISFADAADRTVDAFRLHTILPRTDMLRALVDGDGRLVAEHVYYEDCEYTVKAISTAQTVAATGVTLYHYLYNTATQSVSEQSYVRNIKHLQTVIGRLLAYRGAARDTLAPANLARMDAIIVECLRQFAYVQCLLNPDRKAASAALKQTLTAFAASGVVLPTSYRRKLALYRGMHTLHMGSAQLRALKRLLGRKPTFWEN